MKKYVFATDLHWGYERKGGKKVPLHDLKALNVLLKFVADFQPDLFIYGGDILDCGVISHHNHGRPGATEGLKLVADAKEGHKAFVEPIEELVKGDLIYIVGNHEDWLTDLTDQLPSLEGLIDLRSLLQLDRWKVIPQGGYFNVGKLTFIHGDTLKGGEHPAKIAVTNYEKNIRFGHFHTYQVYTKNSAIDYKNAKTGVAVPCLCGKDPNYIAGSPNKWVQGFNFGYVGASTFNDYVAIVVDGSATISGKVYKG